MAPVPAYDLSMDELSIALSYVSAGLITSPPAGGAAPKAAAPAKKAAPPKKVRDILLVQSSVHYVPRVF